MDGTSPAGDQVPLCMRCNHRCQNSHSTQESRITHSQGPLRAHLLSRQLFRLSRRPSLLATESARSRLCRQVVPKAYLAESVGVTKREGKHNMVEISEISIVQAEACNTTTGELLFRVSQTTPTRQLLFGAFKKSTLQCELVRQLVAAQGAGLCGKPLGPGSARSNLLGGRRTAPILQG